eukprot:855109-Prorocentrum_lima.AAC.1
MVNTETAGDKEKADKKRKEVTFKEPDHGSTATGGGSSNDVIMSDGHLDQQQQPGQLFGGRT